MVDLDGTTSADVTWTYAEDEEESAFIIYLALVLGIAGLVLFVVAQTRTNQKAYRDEQVFENNGQTSHELEEKEPDV